MACQTDIFVSPVDINTRLGAWNIDDNRYSVNVLFTEVNKYYLDNKLIVDHSMYQIDGWIYDNLILLHGVGFILLTVREENYLELLSIEKELEGFYFPE